MEEYHFDGQRTDEDVIFLVKRHPWVLAPAGFISMGLVILLAIFIVIFGLAYFTSVLIIIIILFFILYGFYQWFLFNNYLYILTNQRIIIIEQTGFFNRKVTEAELEKIQNISVEVKGAVKTLLNFGDITLRTAGIDPVMILQNVENPYDLQQKIIKYCKNYSGEGRRQNIIR